MEVQDGPGEVEEQKSEEPNTMENSITALIPEEEDDQIMTMVDAVNQSYSHDEDVWYQ